MLDSLTDFTVIPSYHRARTRFDVYAEGSRDPVAQVRGDRGPDTLRPLDVFTGPALDQAAGWVNAVLAIGPDRARIGKVAGGKRLFGKDRWVFAQNGLPELQGKRAGALGSLRDAAPIARDFLTGGVADAALSARLRFSAPGCQGFEFTRQSGIKTRYKVRVHDERVSRLLVLACVLYYDRFVNADPRREIASATANPFKI